jgi:hypothetical protein
MTFVGVVTVKPKDRAREIELLRALAGAKDAAVARNLLSDLVELTELAHGVPNEGYEEFYLQLVGEERHGLRINSLIKIKAMAKDSLKSVSSVRKEWRKKGWIK